MPSRRHFLETLPGLAALGLAPASAFNRSSAAATVGDAFPRTDPKLVETFVRLAHTDAGEIRRLVERQPSLARASWDWGYGDWETGLGAAAHSGKRDIAELLLVHGARPTIFSVAMMGQLDVVRAFVETSPGVQRTLGPHGLTLMAHARAGGEDRYAFGPGPRDYFDVDLRQDQLGLQRPATNRRFLIHVGDLVFFPSGVPSVRITFAVEAGLGKELKVADPDLVVAATRTA